MQTKGGSQTTVSAAEASSVRASRIHKPAMDAASLSRSRSETEQAQAPEIVHQVLSTPGKPLDPITEDWARGLFGLSFAHVRVHTGSAAARSAKAVGATAYTAGKHIVFGQNAFAPFAKHGKRLIAHELAHVVQQRHAPADIPSSLPIASSASAAEAEARGIDAAGHADLLTRCRTTIPTVMLQRFDSPEHAELGDKAFGTDRFILLSAHARDNPGREKGVAAWKPETRELHNKGSDAQKRFLKEGLTYGEIVALSGDFYESFAELDKAPLREIYDLLPLIRTEATTEQLQRATGGRYLALAKRNESHFSADGNHPNMSVWREGHIQALMAAKAGDANLAYAINATADHFLTDRFAAGHLLTRRANNSSGIPGYIKDKLSSSELSSLSAKLDHDIDNKYGVAVSNARGEVWIAYGDYMWSHPQNANNRAHAEATTKSSIADIQEALSKREKYVMPVVFDAETRVPKLETAKQAAAHDKNHREAAYDKASEGGISFYIAEKTAGDDIAEDWVAKQSDAALSDQPVGEKSRMIGELLTGYVTDSEIESVGRLYRTTPLGEQHGLRELILSFVPSLNSIGQRMRLRAIVSLH